MSIVSPELGEEMSIVSPELPELQEMSIVSPELGITAELPRNYRITPELPNYGISVVSPELVSIVSPELGIITAAALWTRGAPENH
jgi:hypothetical protein